MNFQKIIILALIFVLGVNPFVLAQGTNSESESASKASEEKVSEAILPDSNELTSYQISKIDVLDFKETDIREALDVLEAKTGRVIVVGPEVWGKITIYLQNVEFWDALQIILEANRLAYAKENGIINVMSADEFETKYGYEFTGDVQSKMIPIRHIDPEEMVVNLIPIKSEDGKIIVDRKTNIVILLDNADYLSKMEALIKEMDVPMGTGVFRLRYAQIKDVKQKVEGLLTKNIGRLETDEKTNKITVTDQASKIKEIAKLIEEIDRKIDVLIEAKVFQIRLIEEHKDGIDWEAIVSDYQKADLSGEDKENPDGNIIPVSVGTVTEEDYEVLLEALETVGEVAQLSSSEITAVVNRETKMNLDSNREEESEANTAEREQNSFEMQLRIKPELDEDMIVMRIVPKLLWMSIDRQSSGHWKMATYLSREGNAVKVKSDEIVVLGGLMGEREVAKTSKFPLLGDIPILGFAFRRRNKLIEKMEYVVFLTHKIIKEEAGSE